MALVNGSSNVNSSLSVSNNGSFSDLSMAIILKFIQVLEGALILVITYFIIRWLKKYFSRIETTHEQQKMAISFLEKITNGFVIVIGVTLALKTIGLDMSILVGVCLLGISYGLKDAIKNYIAGILIFLKAPFKIGDIVKIKSYLGKVEKMELQSTTLKTFDNRDITIYNSDVMTKSIENFSKYPMKRIEIEVETGYGTNAEKAAMVFGKILENDPNVLKTPKFKVVFKKFTASAMVFEIKFWVNITSNILATKSSVAWKIHQAFDDKDILTPFAKSFESETAFVRNPEQIQRIQQFYSSNIFQNILPSQEQPTQGQLAPEYLDIDEPE
ncbi:MAG: mechanosensitive ion channel family protein [Candidatus Gracilibacteria bacterium]|jgi:small conductance mechanosensitive channel